MKTTSLILLMSLMTFSGLYAQNNRRTAEFNPQGTLKVVTLNTDDPFLGVLENALFNAGFQVVSNNMIYFPSARSSGVLVDSTGQMVHPLLGISVMPEKPSDYVIRYQYSMANGLDPLVRRRVMYMNITVVNTQSGKIDANFHYVSTHPEYEAMNLIKLADRFVNFLRNGS